MTAYGRNRVGPKRSESQALCGDPRCKTRAKAGLDTRPRVHAATTHGRTPAYDMVGHPFVFGGGTATIAWQ